MFCGCGGDLHRERLVADAAGAPSAPAGGVRVTYLGTNGYVLESASTTVIVDPYFTREGFLRVAANLPIAPRQSRIDLAMARIPPRADLIVVTHGHIDHLLDVPEIARRTGAKVIASPTACFVARAAGLPDAKTSPAVPGDELRIGGKVRVLALPATHDKLFGREIFPGSETSVPARPRRPSDWKCGEPLAFLIEMGGKRIYVESGGTRALLPPARVAPVDLAIMGVALPDTRKRFKDAVTVLRPAYVLPSHEDNFFRPLERGFRYGPLTDPKAVFAAWDAIPGPKGRLILLDYFKPWTLR